jgi:aminoglycoside/choline kinase family phosphotransferase
MFTAAIDTLVAMQRAAPPPGLPVWDAATMAATAQATLFDWWWPAAFGAPPPDAARNEFAAALHQMLAPVAAGPAGFVHRDFFAGNLIWLPRRQGVRRIGVLDFQGAALGHPAYDLASLLQDARVDVTEEMEIDLLGRYARARRETDPDFDLAGFVIIYATLAAQRASKILGIFARLERRDRKPQYLRHLPRVWSYLQRSLALPQLAPLEAWYKAHVPPPA